MYYIQLFKFSFSHPRIALVWGDSGAIPSDSAAAPSPHLASKAAVAAGRRLARSGGGRVEVGKAASPPLPRAGHSGGTEPILGSY